MKTSILLILLANTVLYGDESKAIELLQPLMPNLPTAPKIESSPSIVKPPQKQQKPPEKARTATCSGNVTLGNSRTLHGRLTIPEYLEFNHYSDGIIFNKKIHACEIKTFSINQYAAAKSGDTAFGEFYEFRPSKIRITDQGGMEYEIIEMHTRLTKLNFESKKGKTILFFIFGDEFNPEVGWKNSNKKTFKDRLLDSHPQSVYKIQLEAKGPAKAGKP